MKNIELTTKEKQIYLALRSSMENYSILSDETWQQFQAITTIKTLPKSSVLYAIGDIPKSYAYIYKGLIRAFSCNEKAQEYNKLFFSEDMFPGAMTALLTSTPSHLGFETIEECEIVEINFKAYRELLIKKEDLKLFQIYYLERNWLLDKDQREIEIVQNDAAVRYAKFIERHPNLVSRIPQYHIVAHLGITPTQLSRIRKKSHFDQPM